MLTADDVAYVRGGFVSLASLCEMRGEDPDRVRAWIRDGALPHASYTLDHGTEMVPADYFRLADEAGSPESLRTYFLTQYRQAAARESALAGDAEAEWAAYLTGEYGVCLKEVTPETIVRKDVLVARLERLHADPRPAFSPDTVA